MADFKEKFLGKCERRTKTLELIICYISAILLNRGLSIMDKTKQSQILLIVIERIYEQHSKIQCNIDSTLVDVCREDNISPENVFFAFLLFIIMNCSKESRQ